MSDDNKKAAAGLRANAKVLVVGAGPTGLTAAAFLARQGLTFDLIEPRSGPVTESRALGVHARTLEFMAMLGLDAEFVSRGHQTRYMTFHRHNKPLFRLDFGILAKVTRYPYMLILPQSDTEDILVRHLEKIGQPPLWNSKLVSIDDKGEWVEATIQLPGGEQATCRYDYVIGCDGAGSLVREQSGIAFEGETYDARFLLSEVEVENNAIARDSSHVFMGESTTVAVIPQPGDIYRIVGPDFSSKASGTDHGARREVDFADFRRFLVKHRLLLHVELKEPTRLLAYQVHKRVARNFMKSRVFIAGDAAHVHSPAGGQGMNTGLHDVVNLAWKMGAVLSGQADQSLLASYETERRQAARIIVDGADSAMMRVMSRNLGSRLFFDWVAPVLTRFWQSSRLMAAIAQISWCYEGFSNGNATGGSWTIRPGHRMSDFVLSGGKRLFEHLGQNNWVLVLSGNNVKAEDFLPRAHGISINIKTVRLENPVAGRFGRSFSGALLCRPDGFIVEVTPKGTRFQFPLQFQQKVAKV